MLSPPAFSQILRISLGSGTATPARAAAGAAIIISIYDVGERALINCWINCCSGFRLFRRFYFGDYFERVLGDKKFAVLYLVWCGRGFSFLFHSGSCFDSLFPSMKRLAQDDLEVRGPKGVSVSAISLCGVLPDMPFIAAVVRLRRLSISPPFRRVLSKEQSASYFPVAQTSRRNFIPPDFVGLDSSPSAEAYALRTLGLLSPFQSSAPALPDDLLDAVRSTVRLGAGVSSWRLARLEEFKAISLSLRPLSDRINASRPEHVAWACGDSTHPALVAALSEALNWPDVALASDYYVRGLAIVGEAPDTGLFRRRSVIEMRRAGAKISVPELLSSNIRFTSLLARALPLQFASAVQQGDAEWLRLHRLTWEASIEEVRQGTARGPFTRHQVEEIFGFGKWRPSRRFGVPKGPDGVRPCDDETQSGHNSAFISRHVLVNCPVDFPAAVARVFFDEDQALGAPTFSPIGAAREDVPSAYRIAPSRSPELTVVALVSPFSGLLFFFIIRGMNFGLSAAAQQFCRLPAFVVGVARRIFACPADYYIDDLQVVESELSRGLSTGLSGLDEFPGSAHSSFVSLCDIIAFPLSLPKRLAWAQDPVALGVQSFFDTTHLNGDVRQCVAPATRVKALAKASLALGSDSLSPSLAASLRGNFGFVLGLSSAARGVLSSIGLRQYELSSLPSEFERWPLTEDLRGALSFIIDLFEGVLPDRMFFGPFRARRPVVSISDASWVPPVPPWLVGSGRVAFVCFVPGIDFVFWAASDVPLEVMLRLHGFRQRATHIIPLETIALVSPQFCPELAVHFQDADVLYFADNTTVNASAVKGYSAAPDVARFISSWALRGASRNTRSWIHYVPSALNIADGPSRPTPIGAADEDSLRGLGFPLRRINFTFPAEFGWSRF